MTSRKIIAMLPFYMDGELSAPDRVRVESALKKDPNLRQRYAELEKVRDMLDDDPDLEPEPGYVSRFWTAASQRKSFGDKILEMKIPGLPFRWAPASAFILTVVLIGFAVLTRPEGGKMVRTDPLEAQLEEDDTMQAMDYEIVEDWEFYQNLEFYQDIDLIMQM